MPVRSMSSVSSQLTSAVIGAVEIHEKYDKQLNAYAYALEKILKKPIKEKFFYLFFDNSVV